MKGGDGYQQGIPFLAMTAARRGGGGGGASCPSSSAESVPGCRWWLFHQFSAARGQAGSLAGGGPKVSAPGVVRRVVVTLTLERSTPARPAACHTDAREEGANHMVGLSGT